MGAGEKDEGEVDDVCLSKEQSDMFRVWQP